MPNRSEKCDFLSGFRADQTSPLAFARVLICGFYCYYRKYLLLLSRIMGLKNELRAVFSLKSKNTKENEASLRASSALLVSERYDNASAASERNTGKYNNRIHNYKYLVKTNGMPPKKVQRQNNEQRPSSNRLFLF